NLLGVEIAAGEAAIKRMWNRCRLGHLPLLSNGALLVDEADDQVSPKWRLCHVYDAWALVGEPLPNHALQHDKIALGHDTGECLESLHRPPPRAPMIGVGPRLTGGNS